MTQQEQCNQMAQKLEQLFRQAAPLLVWHVERESDFSLPYWTVQAKASILGREFFATTTINFGELIDWGVDTESMIKFKIGEIAQVIADFLVSGGKPK